MPESLRCPSRHRWRIPFNNFQAADALVTEPLVEVGCPVLLFGGQWNEVVVFNEPVSAAEEPSRWRRARVQNGDRLGWESQSELLFICHVLHGKLCFQHHGSHVHREGHFLRGSRYR